MLGDGPAHVQVDDARLYDGDAVLRVHLQDAVHARGDDDDAAVVRDGAAGEAGAGAAGGDGHPMSAGNAHHFRHLVGVIGEDDGLGQAALDGCVVLVDDEVLGGVEDALPAYGAAEVADQPRVRHNLRVYHWACGGVY